MEIYISGFKIAEKICENASTLIFRGVQDGSGKRVILKVLKPEASTPDRLARFKHEFNILSVLDLPGVIKVYDLARYGDSTVMVLEDIGGTSLDRILEGKPMPPEEFLVLATRLVGIIEAVHKKRITHKEINPSHIIWNRKSDELQIIGFSISDMLPQLTVDMLPPDALEVSLAYISPEQTGRMNRQVDYRTDFYSLGASFYEMLTGRQPFQANSALELCYFHIAARPVPPADINYAIPPVISDIVMKLLAKAAEDRYQSDFGLKADLERCLSELKKTGRIERFELASDDISATFRIPQKLYGREEEVRKLMQAFQRTSDGGTELLLVAGYSGIGKTSLIREIYRPVTEKRGYFISGKFDQYRRNIPYAPLIDAFSDLIRPILCESSDMISVYKEKLLRTLGPNGQVILDVIPEMELIIGKQPPVPLLGPAESRNRFKLVFQDFVRTVATGDRPLVLFLDDLQWADIPSLQLIEAFMTDPSMSHMLIIGAYRDNEVNATHPLITSRDRLREAGAQVQTITLGPLEFWCVKQIIMDTMHSGYEKSEALSTLLISKTNGNPFFLKQFLNTLYSQGYIWFNWDRKTWEWDLEQIYAARFTDNILDLMTGNIRTLSPDLQEVIALAACIGNQFDLATLTIVTESSARLTAARLHELIREGLILPLADTDSRLVLALASSPESSMPGQEYVPNARFKFLHDRVQQSAYMLLEERQQKLANLKIGRLLLLNTKPDELEEHIFDIAGHLNAALEHISDKSERSELTRLNLLAGKLAIRSAAFEPALRYFNYGIECLEKDSWEREYELTLELHTLAAEMASLSGKFERLDQLFATITSNAKTPLDMAGAYESKISRYLSEGNLQEGVDTAWTILGKLGLTLPRYPTADDVTRKFEEALSSYADIPIEELVNLPAMTNREKIAIMSVATKVSGATYIGRPEFYRIMTLNQVELSIKYGNAIGSPYAYGCYGLLLCGLKQDFDTGFRFGKLALALVEKTDNLKNTSKTLEVVNGHVWFFKEHLKTTLSSLEAGYQSGLETGDLEYAGYNAFFYCCNAFFAGLELPGLERKMASYNEGMRRIHAEIGIRWQGVIWQAVLNLMGKSDDPSVLIGDGFDQRRLLPVLEKTKNKATLASFYVITMMLCYLFENYTKAIECAELAEENIDGMLSMFTVHVTWFYDSLARLRLYNESSAAEQERILAKVADNQRQLKKVADYAPMNSLDKWYLVEAELARVLGNGMEAIGHYDQAVALAKEAGYIQEEALSNELLARFWLEKDKGDIARLYMIKAYQCYLRWGATRKVEDLKKRYPGLYAGTGDGVAVPAERIDLSAVLKASRAISGEIVLPQLLETMMRIVIENAGAQKGYLLLEEGGRWTIAAGKRVENEAGNLPYRTSVDKSGEVPASIIYYVARTKDRVVLDDAAGSGSFVTDPYIGRQKVKSVLCAPLLSRGRLIGIVYLENNLATRVFTRDSVQLTEALLSQATVSLENARVYEALRESEERFRKLADSSPMPLVLYDVDERIIYLNQKFTRTYGYMLEDIPTVHNWWLLTYPDSEYRRKVISQWTERVENALAASKEFEPMEAVVTCKDGSARIAEFTGTPLGNLKLVIMQDITERKRIEESLRQTQFALDKFSDSAIWLSAAGNVVYVNETACDRLGYNRDQLLTMHIWDIDTDRDYRPDLFKVNWDMLKAVGTQKFESRHRTSSGHIFPVEVTVSYLRYGDREYLISFDRDITERKQAEDALKEAKAQAELYLDLMSHDIRNMNHIGIGFLDLSLESPTITEEEKELLLNSRASLERSTHLIDNLNKLQRAQSGEIANQKINACAILESVIANFDRMPGVKISLNQDLPRSCPVLANELLHEVFDNLLGNAIKHGGPEPVISVGFEPVTIDGKEYAKFIVEDQGPGIPDELKSVLFRKLRQGETRVMGRGIGLYLVKSLVDSYDGRIWVEDRVTGDYTQGTRFVIVLRAQSTEKGQ